MLELVNTFNLKHEDIFHWLASALLKGSAFSLFTHINNGDSVTDVDVELLCLTYLELTSRNGLTSNRAVSAEFGKNIIIYAIQGNPDLAHVDACFHRLTTYEKECFLCTCY